MTPLLEDVVFANFALLLASKGGAESGRAGEGSCKAGITDPGSGSIAFLFCALLLESGCCREGVNGGCKKFIVENQ